MDSMVVSIYSEWWKKNIIKVNMFAIFLMQYYFSNKNENIELS